MKLFTLFVVFGSLMVQYTLAEKCTSSRPIKNVYVIQRRINFSSTGGCHLTHSGLLFQMIDGKSCVLEYSSDGNARLSDVHSFYYSFPCWFKKCYIVNMDINNDRNTLWTREKNGVPLSRSLGVITPQSARDKMQSIMGHRYHLLKRNSHQAQENLRKLWRFHVHDNNNFNAGTVCLCISHTSSYLVPRELQQIYRTTKEACKEFVH